MWVMLVCVALASDSFVTRGLDYLEASWPTLADRFASDLILGAAMVGSVYGGEARVRAVELALGWGGQLSQGMHTAEEGPGYLQLPDEVAPSDVHMHLGHLFALAYIGLDAPILRDEIEHVLPLYNDMALFGFPLTHAHHTPSCTHPTASPAVTWGRVTQALVRSFVAESAGLQLPSRTCEGTSCGEGGVERGWEQVSVADACTECPRMCPAFGAYPNPPSSPQHSRFLLTLRWIPLFRSLYADPSDNTIRLAEEAMAATHVIYTLCEYTLARCPPKRLVQPELDLLRVSLPVFLRLRSADLIGEALDCLKRYGESAATNTNIAEGETLLLQMQLPNGSWENDYHATIAALLGLRPAHVPEAHIHLPTLQTRKEYGETIHILLHTDISTARRVETEGRETMADVLQRTLVQALAAGVARKYAVQGAATGEEL